jgi:glycosyltransferase involved in cell wall biosynthesis
MQPESTPATDMFETPAVPASERRPANPLISAIIPTLNRRETLLRCLRALFRQTLGAALFEVIVVDDGSSDGTSEAVTALAPEWGGRLLCVRHYPNRGINVARNRGVAASRGEILVIMNDDSITVPGFLAEHLRMHRQHPTESVAVLGRMTIAPELPPSPVTPLHLDATFAALGDRTEHDWTAFAGCNISVKRSFLLRHGIFDPALRWHDDKELAERLSHHGLRVIYQPAALAFHWHYLSVEEFLRNGEKDGRGLVTWYRRRPESRETLVKFGLRTRSFPEFSLRYAIADALINKYTRAGWLWFASLMAGLSKSASLRIYSAVFQAQKRGAITVALAQQR